MSTTHYVDVHQTLQNLKQEDVADENYAAIRDLVDHAAAEGLSESHQQRLVYGLKQLLLRFAPDGFRLRRATEDELKQMIAALHRSEYAEATQHKCRAALKKFYKVEHGGTHPEKVDFFSASHNGKATTVTRDELFTEDERSRLFQCFTNTRDRAFTMLLYESAARPGELLSRNIGDFTSNEKGDFIYLEGLKGTPDRTNQLVRSGRTIREWLAQHPLGGELGDITDPHAPLWVKTEQQECRHCGELPVNHTGCEYEPALDERLKYDAFLRRFKDACERADIPEHKQRPYNLRHTRLTEVATFMGYEQLNKFAGWKPGSDRAKVYVHLNNDDVNKAIRNEYGLDQKEEEDGTRNCPFCNASNQNGHSECRNCGRPLNLEQETGKQEKQKVIEQLAELEEKGVLERLKKLEE